MSAPAPRPSRLPTPAPTPACPTAAPMSPPTAAPPSTPIPAPSSRVVNGVEQPEEAASENTRAIPMSADLPYMVLLLSFSRTGSLSTILLGEKRRAGLRATCLGDDLAQIRCRRC